MNAPLPQYQNSVPPKVESALQYLQFAHGVRVGPYGGGEEWQCKMGRDLSKHEARVYDAALACLLEYFNSDDGFDGAAAVADDPPDDPKEKVPV